MAQLEVPDGWVAQAYRFALDPTPAQVSMLESHCGAALFAFNDMLSVVKAQLRKERLPENAQSSKH
jgi:putative transposase